MGKKPEQTWPMPPVPTPWLAISGGSSSDAILLIQTSKPRSALIFFIIFSHRSESRGRSHVACQESTRRLWALEGGGAGWCLTCVRLRSQGFEANQGDTAPGGQGAPERDQ